MSLPILPDEIVKRIRKDSTDISLYNYYRKYHKSAFKRTLTFIFNNGQIIHNKLNHFNGGTIDSNVKCKIMTYIESILDKHEYDSDKTMNDHMIATNIMNILKENGYNVIFVNH